MNESPACAAVGAETSSPAAAAVLPGQIVIDEIGLMPAVLGLRSEFPNLNKSTVWRWSQSRTAGGTDGIVPARYHVPLLRLAQRLGKTLTPNDLVIGRPG